MNCFVVFLKFGALWISETARGRDGSRGVAGGGWPFSRAFACLSRSTIPEGKG